MKRQYFINHILDLMKIDIDYARYALRWYHKNAPWLDLMAGVREALKDKK
jgi:uncharacterized protein involved in copper resistance